jgi:hypothetical protein
MVRRRLRQAQVPGELGRGRVACCEEADDPDSLLVGKGPRYQ